MPIPLRNPGVTAAAVLLVAVGLAGCTANPVAATVVPTTKAAPHPSPAISRSASAAVDPLGIDVAKAKTVHLDCSTLVPDSAVTAFDSKYTSEAGYLPKPGSSAASIVAAKGTACGWQDSSSGSTLQVAVARPSAADLLTLKNTLVDTSNSVPTYGEEAYFKVTDSVGEVDAFHGAYWILAISPDFFEPGDASEVIAAVGNALDKR